MPKKEKVGQVVSIKMDKTVVVAVPNYKQHPIYKKIICETKKYSAHNDSLECAVGDEVRIIESKPISKTKKWAVVEITKKTA